MSLTKRIADGFLLWTALWAGIAHPARGDPDVCVEACFWPGYCLWANTSFWPGVDEGLFGSADPVFVLGLGLPWGYFGAVFGASVALAGNTVCQSSGLMLAPGVNFSENVLGFQVAGGMNDSRNSSALQVAVGFNRTTGLLRGAQVGTVNCAGGEACGLQLGVVNWAEEMTGVQFGVFNRANDARGLQLGVVNRAGSLRGVQIGLANFAADSTVGFLPLARIGF